MSKIVEGTRVRWNAECRETFKSTRGMADAVGTVVPGIGKVKPPPGGLYVLWDRLREPMAVFVEDLEEAT